MVVELQQFTEVIIGGGVGTPNVYLEREGVIRSGPY